MKKVWIIIFIGCISSSYSQENWILYPKKESLDSLKVKSLSNNENLTHDSLFFKKIDNQKNINTINYISEIGSLVGHIN